MSKEEDLHEIPNIIVDTGTKTTYQKGRFFGKGGFARCYEITDTKKGQVFAGKIVSKTLMTKHNQREKMSQEISIHQSLLHKNVVGFYGFFEDSFNVYIVLELCRKRSMMELHKRRKTITEPETRYYMRQIVNGVNYLHGNRIIHRDLKLGNLFLNDDLQVKIGDFGLAAKLEHEGERKKTLCGTPNYIAPEILTKKGHSFEVDIWSIGCIMYTLLMGRPPFETNSLKETYSKIRKCDYKLPKGVTKTATTMIIKTLQSEPKLRPTIGHLMDDEFLTCGLIPTSLPTSCLTMAPRIDQLEKVAIRKPLIELNGEQLLTSPEKVASRQSIAARQSPGSTTLNEFKNVDNLTAIRDMLQKVLSARPGKANFKYSEEMSDPAAQPLFWISKWVDYSDKYGFGYHLCDESVGVMFNDNSKLIMLSNAINIHYIRKGEEIYMTADSYPQHLEKKMKLLSYFQRYMREHLVKAGASATKEVDSMSRIPHLYQWCRSNSSVLMQLTNGTIQVNFMDHTKIILCPLMGAVTYIDEEKNFRTFRCQSITENGCSVGLEKNLKYTYNKILALIDAPRMD